MSRLSNGSERFHASINGYTIESDQALKFRLARDHLNYLDEMITKTEVELYVRIKSHLKLVQLIVAMPGMTELSATILLAEIGVDMSVFEDAKHFTSWAGLSPANNESAGKKKSVRISKAVQYIKPLLAQCALAATRIKKEPYFAIKYQHIKKHRATRKPLLRLPV